MRERESGSERESGREGGRERETETDREGGYNFGSQVRGRWRGGGGGGGGAVLRLGNPVTHAVLLFETTCLCTCGVHLCYM